MPMHVAAACLAATLATAALMHGERVVQTLLPRPGRVYDITARIGDPGQLRWEMRARFNPATDTVTVRARNDGPEAPRHRRIALLDGHLVVTIDAGTRSS